MSIADELYGRPKAGAWDQPAQPGLVLAEVTDLKDPKKLGRIKCRVLTEDKANLLDWCYVMMPLAGKQHGIQFLPDVGDLVVLAFVGGDRQRPVVMGCLWNNEIPMPYPLKDGKNFSFTIKTPSGSEILLDGEKGKEKITAKTPAESKIIMDDEKQSITITDKGGKNLIKMDLKGGEMQILADKKITLKAGSSSLELNGSGSVTLKSSNTLTLDAATIELKAKSQLKGQGTQVEMKANAQLKLSGTGQASLESTGITNVKGTLLNLN